ncbi:PRC-barrel domain-containing protein [Paracoccus tibetensis]|uniref:PRC-barrel domain-containing protein n=1 Tax=Paracoccus tibetensis TaxID=336292 RepID=UPI000B849623|nr:PRC-barrel domain-containing protein [Paracoccus tibetensis]
MQDNQQFQQAWLDEAAKAAQSDDPQLCAQYVAQAEQTTAQGDEVERIEGRIVVTQEPPTVAVEQPAPEVNVTQPEPRVSVAQPQPEIIVRMPDPQVSVETPDPQIEVNQAQPRVSVQQGEPQVDVAVEDTPDQEGQQQADVQVQQGTPQVRLQQQQGEQAQVDVQQAQPRVTYEAAEPNIEFSGGGEPQVQFTESGEPNVSFVGQDGAQQQAGQEQAGQEQQAQQQAAQQQQPAAQAAGQQPAQQQARPPQAQRQAGAGDDAWRGGRQAMTAPQVQLQGYEQAEPSSLSIDNLMSANVYGAGDNNIGNVQDVVASQGGEVEYIVLDIGGFLGLGAHTIALGMDEVSVLHRGGNDIRVHVDATREQLEQMPEYQG